jgi:hypothetical protein
MLNRTETVMTDENVTNTATEKNKSTNRRNDDPETAKKKTKTESGEKR